jgi:hypothetical protein
LSRLWLRRHITLAVLFYSSKKKNMTTVKKITKAICILLLTGHTAFSQESSGAKNFIGSYIGIDWNNASRFQGISYERLVYGTAATEFGIRGSYTLPHGYGNLNLLFYSFEPPVSQVRLGGQGYFFTGRQKVNTGFFITAGAGIEFTSWEEDIKKYHEKAPYGELGFGWKWPIGKKLVLRWTNTLSFATQSPLGGANTTTVSALALGF